MLVKLITVVTFINVITRKCKITYVVHIVFLFACTKSEIFFKINVCTFQIIFY